MLRKVSEVAEKLQVSRPTMWRLIYGGEIAVVRIGRCVRISDAAIAEYVSQNTHQRPTPAKMA